MNQGPCTKENSFTANNKFGNYKLLVCNICRAVSHKGCSIAEDIHGEKHYTTLPIGEMERKFKKHGLYIHYRGRLINANHISKEYTSEINYFEIKMTTGKPVKLSRIKRAEAIRQNKKQKNTSWFDFLFGRNKKEEE